MTNWKPLSEPPDLPGRVILFYPGSFDAAWDGSDYGIIVGYYGGTANGVPDWREQGTNHDCFEQWKVEAGYVPTLWAPIDLPCTR